MVSVSRQIKGTIVEGEVENTNKSVLRVNMWSHPPGFEAPLEDFEIKAAKGK